MKTGKIADKLNMDTITFDKNVRQHSFKAVVLRGGFLLGAGGIVEGLRAGPALVVPGQGWSEVNLLKAEDLADVLASIIDNAPNEAGEEGKGESR